MLVLRSSRVQNLHRLLRRQAHFGSPPLHAAWALPERNPAGSSLQPVGDGTEQFFQRRWWAEAQTVAELLDLRAEFASEASQPSNVGSFWNAVGRLARSSQERQWLAQPEGRAALAAAAVGDLDAVVDDLAPRELTAVAIGLASARLAHTTPFAALFSRLARAAASMPELFRDGELILLIDAASRAGRTGPSRFFATLTSEAGRRIASTHGRVQVSGLHGLMQSCARVSFCSTALLDAIAAELVRGDLLNKIPPNHLIDMIWALAVADHMPAALFARCSTEGIGGNATTKGESVLLIQHLCHVLSAIREARDVQQTGLQNSSLARLHEVKLWLGTERLKQHSRGGQNGADAAAAAAERIGLPDGSPLAVLCHDAFIEQQQAPARQRPGSYERAESALREIGYEPRKQVTERGHVLPLVIQHGGIDVAVEIEPPFGFHHSLPRSIARISQIKGLTRNGWLTLRQRQLRAFATYTGGQQLLAVPFWELHPRLEANREFALHHRVPWAEQPREAREALHNYFRRRLSDISTIPTFEVHDEAEQQRSRVD